MSVVYLPSGDDSGAEAYFAAAVIDYAVLYRSDALYFGVAFNKVLSVLQPGECAG